MSHINHIRQVVELWTDEHAKKIIFLEKMTEFWLSYVRILLSMGSSASIKIRTSVHCYSMCPIGCGSSRRKSGDIVVVAAPSRSLGFLPGEWILPNLRSYRRYCHPSMELAVDDSVYPDETVVKKP